MKRNLIIIVSIFIGVFVLMLTSDIITIGEKLAHVTHQPYVEYGFYLLILLVFAYLIILPIYKLHHAPTFPKLTIDVDTNNMTDESRQKLVSFGNRLARHCDYIPAEERKDYQRNLVQALECYHDDEDLVSIVQEELDHRYKTIKSHIHEWAKTVFMITSLCQSGKIDALTSMVINFRMIGDLIRCSGFKPTHRQLFNQYARILVTSLFSYYISNSLSNFEDIAIPLDDAVSNADVDAFSETEFLGGMTSLKISGIIPASIIDGALNTLITLRIGYVTLSYLKKGSEELKGKSGVRVRRSAMLASAKDLGELAKDSTISGVQFLGKKINELLYGAKPSEAV